MSCILKTNAWASLAACLAIALAAASAVAQQEESQDQTNQDQTQSSDEQNQQTRQRDEQASQNQQSQQSDQQRTEQQRQREEQERQRDQQDRQRDEQSRDRTSRDDSAWPSPNRYESDSDARQWSRTSEFSRDEEQSASSSERNRQGGLGVNIATDDREGVVVRHVHRGSPAEEMGIRAGDRITQVNGQEVNSTREFVQTIRNMDPGEEVELDIRRARGGGEQTVRGELETRGEALAEHSGEQDRYGQSGDRWSSDQGERFGEGRLRDQFAERRDEFRDRLAQRPDRDNWQTSYEEEQRSTIGGQRSGQMSSTRIQQLERQVDRLSQQIDDLRQSLQDLRRQGREQTARYDEFESQSPRRSATRWDNTNRYRQSDRSRTTTGRSGEFGTQRSTRQYDGEVSRDAQRSEFDDSPARTYESRRIDPDQGRSTSEGNEPDSPGGEIGSDRQHVGTEDIQE